MLESLKHSNEPEHLVAEAKRYLRALKGNLVQLKKKKEEKERAMREAEAQAAFQLNIFTTLERCLMCWNPILKRAPIMIR
ncbi:hypothetical protein D0864_01319 [Hortaea werneckii]|uniref:Uncharacterized protein n=1 Tax=Hortaea werneckii TaxID=91943 RepID=A0A3M7HB88_HORWE|nr:hypothetical protein D0864_01319 [Hortaea werneckii]